MVAWVSKECASEKKPDQTNEQFLYKSRKKALGPFKRSLWSLPADVLDAIGRDLEAKFSFYFLKLRVAGSRELVASYCRAIDVPLPRPDPVADGAAGLAEVHGERDLPASEHAD